MSLPAMTISGGRHNLSWRHETLIYLVVIFDESASAASGGSAFEKCAGDDGGENGEIQSTNL